MQDLQLKQTLLQQAVDKLKASIQFGRADPDPANALGDVVMDAAEVVIQLHNTSSSCRSQSASTPTAGAAAVDVGGTSGPVSSNAFGGSAALPADVAAQAAGLLQQAANEGYMAALTISRTNADALVGCS